MPILDPNPPPFKPCGQYMQDQKEKMDKLHSEEFLLPDERALLHDFICKQNPGFAWDDSERGSFRTNFFPPVDFPVILHMPWVEKNILIPPGIYDEVCTILHKKIEAGVYEPSNSSYRSKWFVVFKKDRTSLRPVHSLEPLNAVISDTQVLPQFQTILRNNLEVAHVSECSIYMLATTNV